MELQRAPRRHAGAAGFNNAAARIAGLLAAALLPGAAELSATGANSPDAFPAGFVRAMWMCAGMAAAAGAVAFATIDRSPREGGS